MDKGVQRHINQLCQLLHSQLGKGSWAINLIDAFN